MKSQTVFVFVILLTVSLAMISSSNFAFADYSTIIVEPAIGSAAPGCELTANGCYYPSAATVDVGGKVIFSNTDDAVHTFTAGTPSYGQSGEFDSSLVMVGDSFEWTPDTVGEFPYLCMVHPWMIGTIIVQDETPKLAAFIVTDRDSYTYTQNLDIVISGNIGDMELPITLVVSCDAMSNPQSYINMFSTDVQNYKVDEYGNFEHVLGTLGFGCNKQTSVGTVTIQGTNISTSFQMIGDIVPPKPSIIESISWDTSTYKSGDTGIFTLVSNIPNRDSRLIDIDYVRLSSDSDLTDSTHVVVETDVNSGVFVGDVQFGDHTKNESFLKVSGGDSVYVKFGSLIDSATIRSTFVNTPSVISVWSDELSYQNGDVIEISGKVSNLQSGISVSLVVTAPNGNLVHISQHPVRSDGSFSTTLDAGGSLMKADGLYKITVNYGTANVSSSSSFEFGGMGTTPGYSSDIIAYTITSGQLHNIAPDLNANSIVVSMDAPNSGSLTLTIPRTILDSVNNNEDDDFFVLINSAEADFQEMTTSTDRMLSISFPKGTETIEIIGTFVISANLSYKQNPVVLMDNTTGEIHQICSTGTELVNGVCQLIQISEPQYDPITEEVSGYMGNVGAAGETGSYTLEEALAIQRSRITADETNSTYEDEDSSNESWFDDIPTGMIDKNKVESYPVCGTGTELVNGVCQVIVDIEPESSWFDDIPTGMIDKNKVESYPVCSTGTKLVNGVCQLIQKSNPTPFDNIPTGLINTQKIDPQTQIKVNSLDSKISREQSQYNEYYKQYEYYNGKTLSVKDEQKLQKIMNNLDSQIEKITSMTDERDILISQGMVFSDNSYEETVKVSEPLKQTPEIKPQEACFLFWCW